MQTQFATKFHELQICQDQGWSYERDWLSLSRDERALWIAYFGVADYHVRRQREIEEQEGALR